MKRALGLIDSKMAQAKNWLRDPNAPPGNKRPYHLLYIYSYSFPHQSNHLIMNVIHSWCVHLGLCFQGMRASRLSARSLTKLGKLVNCVLGRSAGISWAQPRHWARWLTRCQRWGPGILSLSASQLWQENSFHIWGGPCHLPWMVLFCYDMIPRFLKDIFIDHIYG